MDIISFRSLSSYYSHVCVDEIDRKITNSTNKYTSQAIPSWWTPHFNKVLLSFSFIIIMWLSIRLCLRGPHFWRKCLDQRRSHAPRLFASLHVIENLAKDLESMNMHMYEITSTGISVSLIRLQEILFLAGFDNLWSPIIWYRNVSSIEKWFRRACEMTAIKPYE